MFDCLQVFVVFYMAFLAINIWHILRAYLQISFEMYTGFHGSCMAEIGFELIYRCLMLVLMVWCSIYSWHNLRYVLNMLWYVSTKCYLAFLSNNKCWNTWIWFHHFLHILINHLYLTLVDRLFIDNYIYL